MILYLIQIKMYMLQYCTFVAERDHLSKIFIFVIIL